MKNEKGEGVGGGWGGRSREVWVITFGFADLINDLSPADFNQTTLVFIIFISFHLQSVSLYFSFSKLSYMYKTVDVDWVQLYCAAYAELGMLGKKCFGIPGSIIPQLSKLGSPLPNFLVMKPCNTELYSVSVVNRMI